ncbi:FAD-dependent oxidoreductase [Microbacterium sp. X-17]|uniref:NAD(P)/FAD-dependent oxidoreductase n=1 Tax=Microbacterium sp. X-17 TaxID=3144404 RepID=UPI0031F492FE
MRRIAVVGASLAGLNAARTLRERGYEGELVVIGDESGMPYDRPPLSKEILTGAWEPDALDLGGGAVEADWLLGQRATGVDVEARVVTTTDHEVPFDGLVIATGLRARQLPFAPADRTKIFTLRTVEDAIALRGALATTPRVLIIGTGFIGVEVASSAQKLGCPVTLIGDVAPLSVVGPQVSSTCAGLLEAAGVRLSVGPMVDSLSVEDGVAVLTDGTRIEFDIAVVAIGSIPNTEWLRESVVPVEDGVLSDADCRVVGLENIVVAGDVARWPNPFLRNASVRVEHWSNAVEQGKTAALSLLGIPAGAPVLPSFWSDHCGIRLQGVGSYSAADRAELVAGDPEEGRYAIAVHRDDELVGGLAYGMPKEIARLRARLTSELRERVG